MSKASLGFSLVEVLVAMAILAVLAAVSLPNFHRFTSDSVLSDTTQNLLTAFQTVQSSAQNGMVCSDGLPSDEWAFVLTASSYQAECLRLNTGTGNEDVISSNPVVNFPTGITLNSPGTFEFSHLVIKYGDISSPTVLFTPIQVTLTQSGSGSQTEIVVNPGGGINLGY